MLNQGEDIVAKLMGNAPLNSRFITAKLQTSCFHTSKKTLEKEKYRQFADLWKNFLGQSTRRI